MNKEEARTLLHNMVNEFIDADYEIPDMTETNWLVAFTHDLLNELAGNHK